MTIRTLLNVIWWILIIGWLIFYFIFSWIPQFAGIILAFSTFIPIILQEKLSYETLNKKLFSK